LKDKQIQTGKKKLLFPDYSSERAYRVKWETAQLSISLNQDSRKCTSYWAQGRSNITNDKLFFPITAPSSPSKVHCGYSQRLVKAKILMWALTDKIPMPKERFLGLPGTNPGVLILPVFGG